MSFVDLMGNDRWSDADITRRTESMVREHFSAAEEMILARRVTGQGLGFYAMTAADQAELVHFVTVVETARQEGIAARADAALLDAALDLEAAQTRVAQPVPDLPAMVTSTDEAGSAVEIANPALAQDAADRAAAQAVIDAASQPARDLVAQRVAARAPVVEVGNVPL